MQQRDILISSLKNIFESKLSMRFHISHIKNRIDINIMQYSIWIYYCIKGKYTKANCALSDSVLRINIRYKMEKHKFRKEVISSQ